MLRSDPNKMLCRGRLARNGFYKMVRVEEIKVLRYTLWQYAGIVQTFASVGVRELLCPGQEYNRAHFLSSLY